jgi:hypothetical protein
MLPIPFKKFIPRIFQSDSRSDNMATIADTHLKEWKNNIVNIKRLINPVECPVDFIDELGYFVGAEIQNTDTEDQKRKKIYNAIETQKLRSTFLYDSKLRIDSITGLNSKLVTMTDIHLTSDWILCGDGTEPSAYYWSALGCDGVDADLGIDLIGDGTEIVVAGNVYVNCHFGILISTLTASEIAAIKLYLADSVPAYMRMFLGYVDASNNFQYYANGQIH